MDFLYEKILEFQIVSIRHCFDKFLIGAVPFFSVFLRDKLTVDNVGIL